MLLLVHKNKPPSNLLEVQTKQNGGWFSRHESGDTWTGTIFVPFATAEFRLRGMSSRSEKKPGPALIKLMYESDPFVATVIYI